MRSILLNEIEKDELLGEIRSLLVEELQKINKQESEMLYNTIEAAKLFAPPISRQTLKLWTRDGRIPAYKIGGRVFYKKSEIVEAAKAIKKYKKWDTTMDQECYTENLKASRALKVKCKNIVKAKKYPLDEIPEELVELQRLSTRLKSEIKK